MKEFREELGLSQEDLSLYLDIPRSTIALSERGLRNLPTKASLKLSRLEILNASLQVGEFSRDEKQTQFLKTQFEKRLRQCEFKVKKLRWELEKREAKFQQAWRKRALLEKLKLETPPDDALSQKWIEWQERLVAYFFSADAVAELDVMKFEIDLLTIEIERIKNYLSTLSVA
jgi:transcriptional regulator with XRE-family HTH domain